MGKKVLKILFTNCSPLIKYGIAQGFKQLGHEIFIMDDEFRIWDKSKEEQVIKFIEAVELFQPNLVFSEAFANYSEQIFEYTREKGIFHAYWAIEDTPFDHWIGDYWSDYADYIFTTTAECLPNYWNKGKKAELMLFGCNPEFHKNIKTNIKRDIVLMANNYDRRSEQTKTFIMPLIKQGYDVSVYGNEWWMDENKPVHLCDYSNVYKGYGAYENMSELYCSSKVVLGQNLDDKSITQTSMRPVEVLATGGGLLVSPYTMAQEYLFHDLVYLPKTTDEMFLMVDEVLNMSDTIRKRKAKKAQDFVYKYHNYQIRAQQVIDAFLYKW